MRFPSYDLVSIKWLQTSRNALLGISHLDKLVQPIHTIYTNEIISTAKELLACSSLRLITLIMEKLPC